MKEILANYRRTMVRDVGVIFGLFGLLLAVAIYFEAFEYVRHIADTHERWEVDEIMTVLMVMPLALAFFARRRMKEVQRELVRRVAAERAAQEISLHDPLTGLPNRRKAAPAIDAALAKAQDIPVAVMLMDLNRFKAVNDLHGHKAGDALLLQVAARLKVAAGERQLVGRLSGDEFVIMLQGLSGDALIARCDTISRAFDEPFRLGEVSVVVGASIGVTTVAEPGMTSGTALAQADAAMYRCKGQGRNGVCFFENGMELAAFHRARIEAELNVAIAEDRIEPYFQPLVDLESGNVLGYEVLARWRLHDGTLRMPDDFIGIAEESGLISALFYNVLRRSARAVRHWPAHWYFSVNLSPVQFADNWLVENVLKILLEEGVAPGRLEVEITETALVADLEVAERVIRAFKSQGIQIALDDFGTGYSSLRHLSELPFDKLKIDRSFVHNIETNPSAQQIVRSVTSLAHSLGLKVTVEGVETLANAQSIRNYGCDIGQGYFFGKPAQDTRLLRDETATFGSARPTRAQTS